MLRSCRMESIKSIDDYVIDANLDTLRDGKDRFSPVISGGVKNVLTTDGTVVSRFLSQVAQKQNQDAICCIGGSMTYAELDDYSSQLAERLFLRGLQKENIVLCRFTKSPWAIVSFLGILRAGLAFTPIDPSHPASRVQQIAKDTGSTLILVSENCPGEDEQIESWKIDSQFFHSLGQEFNGKLPVIERMDLAYVYFTSGSTGRPKGVMIEHGSMCTSLVAHGERLNISSTSRVLQATSFTFDPCLTEIFATLIHGGCICVPENLSRLSATVNQLAVNWAFFTPSTISLLEPDEVPTLKTIAVGGEALTQECIDAWASRVRLFNSYGPTEASIFCSIAITGPRTRRSCIGHAVGCRTWIVRLTDHNTLANIGEVGELIIEGETVARGYLNSPKATAAVFVTELAWATSKAASGRARRFYKTGDLARLSLDGTIDCLGRRDRQVKVRGQRLELGDIESHIKKHLGNGIQNVRVDLIRIHKDTAEQLVSFVVLSSSVGAITESGTWKVWCSELREHLLNHIPSYMVPSEFISIQSLPTTSNGKVDRSALMEIFKTRYSDVALKSTSSDHINKHDASGSVHNLFGVEVSHVLSLDPSCIDFGRTFCDLGGNSLLAIKLVSRLRKSNIHLSTRDILRATSLLELSNKADSTASNKAAALGTLKDVNLLSSTPAFAGELQAWVASQCNTRTEDIEGVYPCTSFQETLIPSLTSQPTTFVARYVFKLRDDIDLGRFKMCWEDAYRIFPILRSRFVIAPKQGAVRAVVQSTITWNNEEGFDRAAGLKVMENMDIGTELSVFSLASCDVGRWEFVLIMHHLIFDEWSLQLCLEYVAQVYEGLKPPDSTPLFDGFVGYSVDAAQSKASKDFWCQQLGSTSAAQFPRLPSPDYHPRLRAHHNLEVKSPTLRGTKLSALVRASLALAIGLHTGQDDTCFGTVMSGRDADMPGIDEVVGPTLVTIPVRVTWSPEQTVSQIIEMVDRQQQSTTSHEHFGLQNIRKSSVGASRACNFQTMLVIQSPSPRDKTHSLFGDPTETEMRDSHALVIECTLKPDMLLFEARFDTAVITTKQCERFLNLWEHILRQLSNSDGNMTISSLSKISPTDCQTLAAWNESLPPPSPGLVHDGLSRWSMSDPDNIAVESWDGTLTYRQLDDFSSSLAQLLMATSPGPIVPLYFPRGLPLILAVWAVLKAGRGFLCLDPEIPTDRLAHILEELNNPMFLTQNATLPEPLSSLNFWTIDHNYLNRLTRKTPPKPWQSNISPHEIAYMIMTSGSTGRPKGVLIEHESIMTTISHSGPAWGIRKSSRMLQFASLAFDAAVMVILSAAVHGACLCIPEQKLSLDELTQFVKEKKVNWAFFTPSFLRLVSPAELPGLETVAAGGEAMTTEVSKIWAAKTKLVNAYGPCECAVTCACTIVDCDSANISSIGRAVGCSLWVVDREDHERLVPLGTVGELLIEGSIVGRGYLNDAEKTAAAFISPPPWTAGFSRDFCKMYKTGDLVRYDDDGHLLYVGRKDNQVKLRGQRLELGEVEHNIQLVAPAHPVLSFVPKKGILAKHLVVVLGASLSNLVPTSVYQAVPLLRADSHQSQAHDIRRQIARKLPDYMVPERFAFLQDLPVSLSGKLDRRVIESWLEQLTSIDESIFSTGEQSETLKSREKSSTRTETVMQRVWAAVLGLSDDAVAVNRSFHALGGDSIMAMQAIARGRNQGLNITIKDLLRGDDIKVLSRRSDSVVDPRPTQSLLKKGQPMPLSAIQTAYSLLAPISQPHHFNQSVQVLAQRRISPENLRAAIRAVVSRHESLRTRYDFTRLRTPTQCVSEDVEGSFSIDFLQVNCSSSLNERVKEFQSIPNPVTGPLIHCTLVEQPNSLQRMILVAPHLAVDIVSWKLILEDIETVLEGRCLEPAPSVSYMEWCEKARVRQAVKLNLPGPLHDYWGYGSSSLTYADVARESFTLDGLTTEACLKDSNACLRTKPTDLFIAAILWAFRSTFDGREYPVLCLEGHGRQRPSIDLDVSGTVGWFTTVVPVHVPVAKGEDLLQFCRRIKDERFQSESIGADFFEGQSLSGSRDVDIPEIMVNFTGASRTSEGSGLLIEDANTPGDLYDFSDSMRRFAVFDFSISVDKGELRFELLYNHSVIQEEHVKEWLFKCKCTLEEISALSATCQPRPTISDHPEMIMSYDNLDGLGRDLQNIGISILQRELGPWAESIFPATPVQNQMLRSQKENSKYWHVTMMLRASTTDSSQMDLDRIMNAWKKVVTTHGILRTIFLPNPQASSTDFMNIVVQNISLSDMVNISSSMNLLAIPRTKWRSARPQHRLHIAKYDETSMVCRLEINHALVDHASIPIILENFSRAYQDSSMPLHEVSYQKYASTIPSKGTRFWSDYLGKAQPTRVTGSSTLDLRRNESLFSVPINTENVIESVGRILKAHGITVATLFRLAWALVLRQHIGMEEVVFGFMISGRDGQVAEVDRVVGPAINIGACRVKDFERGTLALLKATQQDFFDVLEQQHSLVTFLNKQRKTDPTGLFDTIVNVRQHQSKQKASGSLVFEDLPGSEDPYEYAVVVEVDVHDELKSTASMTCWSESIPKQDAQQLAELFKQSLEKISADISVEMTDTNAPCRLLASFLVLARQATIIFVFSPQSHPILIHARQGKMHDEMSKHLAIGVLGCGKLGTAILQGLLSGGTQKLPQLYTITRVTVSVRSESAAKLLSKKLEDARAAASESSVTPKVPEVQVLRGDSRLLISQSDVVILGCKPYDFEKALGTSGARDALLESADSKILVSILGGVSTSQLWDCVRGGGNSGKEINLEIVRVIPNLAARLRQSMTVIALPENGRPSPAHEVLTQLFSDIGAVEYLPETLMDNGSSLCASTTAIFATLIASVAKSDGALEIDTRGGNLRNNALRMAAYAARGAADLILSGQIPAEIISEVATPGGATRKGLDKLEEDKLPELINEAMGRIYQATGALGVKKDN
ncbi:Acetyl-CoA synthetase-like protein [Glarea lozoyensis ATCC 20868]|uniref:Acetyl-CoA synthetase-like protein n=1 Tax=Glarea lozoyensis (strain ATCC 20868 / MF5171) TaxID=1116229 RepID=S3CRY2_GLAL2|nr:Acetyl-CoA synthetase-like protein [Glarea lozoyensis ATCC 20868]EPE28435.1 Acetyl-CoA synthetase-like protein [Glarea lozoyensis ATCC 20868]